jgi:hypothetical protein
MVRAAAIAPGLMIQRSADAHAAGVALSRHSTAPFNLMVFAVPERFGRKSARQPSTTVALAHVRLASPGSPLAMSAGGTNGTRDFHSSSRRVPDL